MPLNASNYPHVYPKQFFKDLSCCQYYGIVSPLSANNIATVSSYSFVCSGSCLYSSPGIIYFFAKCIASDSSFLYFAVYFQ